MNDIFLIACALSLPAACAALAIAARHAIHLEKCRGTSCNTEGRP